MKFAVPLIAALLLPSAFSFAQATHPRTGAKQAQLLPSSTPEGFVAQRDFFVLTAIWSRPAVLKAMAGDNALTRLSEAHTAALTKAIGDCTTAACFVAALRWSPEEVKAAAAELRHLCVSSPALQTLAENLRSSGNYPLYSQESTSDLLATAWTDAAQSMDRVLDVYGAGLPPHYAKIDSVRFDTKSSAYVATLHAMAMLIADEDAGEGAFFFPVLKASIDLLAINDRLDAGRFEPLSSGANAAAIAHARLIDWSKYPASVILVPGAGPDEPGEAISPRGRLRVEQAVELYRSGKAPFLLVSGGTVHPMLTRFCEAMEMRLELMTEWNVPADAILVDPYARHTTTNIRNAVREISRYRLPMNQPFLVSSDYGQIARILAPSFDQRCRDELHYLPYTLKRSLSPVLLEMRPDARSLQMDAMDPLDP